jgi:hypothetical protein
LIEIPDIQIHRIGKIGKLEGERGTTNDEQRNARRNAFDKAIANGYTNGNCSICENQEAAVQSPFPGMNPYIERRDLWPNVHSSLIIALRDTLAPQLRPHYYVAVEERAVWAGIDDLAFAVRPDVSIAQSPFDRSSAYPSESQQSTKVVTVEVPTPDIIRELYLEIREVRADRVVTVLEILSPTNKTPGEGRRQYEQKRLGVLGSFAHLVEVDLLRAGEPMLVRGYDGGDYRILVSRAERRPLADLTPFNVRQVIPTFKLPLQPNDDEPEVDLNRLLHEIYDRAGYDLRIDYRADATPPLSEQDVAWADELLRAAGLR